jgi:predicted nuclease of predicted toxin-antitoxin system
LSLFVLLDQNVPPPIADYIRSRRPEWAVRHTRNIGFSGASDEAIFRWAQDHRKIVITFDEDFADARM